MLTNFALAERCNRYQINTRDAYGQRQSVRCEGNSISTRAYALAQVPCDKAERWVARRIDACTESLEAIDVDREPVDRMESLCLPAKRPQGTRINARTLHTPWKLTAINPKKKALRVIVWVEIAA